VRFDREAKDLEPPAPDRPKDLALLGPGFSSVAGESEGDVPAAWVPPGQDRAIDVLKLGSSSTDLLGDRVGVKLLLDFRGAFAAVVHSRENKLDSEPTELMFSDEPSSGVRLLDQSSGYEGGSRGGDDRNVG
jgi:hypothetical protein